MVYGCSNPHFGGNGTVLRINEDNGTHRYKSTGGVRGEEGIGLLQKFYEIPNLRVPEEKRKSKRAKKTTQDFPG